MNAREFATFLSNPGGNPKTICAHLGKTANLFSASVEASDAGHVSSIVIDPGPMGNPYLQILSVRTPLKVAVSMCGPVPSYRLHTTPYADVKDRLQALPGLVLPVKGGPSVMVTSQLSGCSLVYQPSQSDSKEVRVIHIQPSAGMSGVQLEQELKKAEPLFAPGLLPTKIYGQEEQIRMPASVNVIALRHEERWTLYAQEATMYLRQVYGAYTFPMYQNSRGGRIPTQ